LPAARTRGALCLRSNIATVARSDTTGAVYGEIAGAYYGVEGIPEKWRHKLAELRTLERFALALMKHPR
jgi:ADP-ribosylglycohydrolase